VQSGKGAAGMIEKYDQMHILLDEMETAQYDVGGIRPMAVIKPESNEELSHWLSECSQQRARVNVWGSGLHQHIGGKIAQYDLVISTERLDKTVEFEPENLTITVQSGMKWNDVHQLLKDHRLFLPLHFAGCEMATCGGILAANLYGTFSHFFGAARDMVLGLNVALAHGDLVHFGGKTMKNVAGYDMVKLFIGSLGTIGLISDITFKLWPRPFGLLYSHLQCHSLDHCNTLLQVISRSALPIWDVTLSRRIDGKPLLHCTIQDFDNQTISAHKKFVQLPVKGFHVVHKDVDSLIDFFSTHGDWFVRDRDSLILKWVIPPAQVCPVLSRFEKDAIPVDIMGYPTRGILFTRIPLSDDASIKNTISKIMEWRRMTNNYQGSVIIWQAPIAIKEAMDAWDTLPMNLNWFQKMKSELDPRGVFAPGRFIGGI
jgi:glycolate oxidase FAD binding subunit